MSEFEVRLLDLDQRAAWNDAISECGLHDAYHSAAYHQLARERTDDRPVLFVFRGSGGTAALPFLIRKISGVPGVNGSGLKDAASAYGYPGLLSSVEKDHSDAQTFRQNFQTALMATLDDVDLVSLFVRQNPLLPTSWMLTEVGDVHETGRTVAIDLSMTEDQQRLQTSENHRRNLKKAMKYGVTVEQDESLRHLEEFKALYRQTMRRVGAADHYFFSDRYFDSMADILGSGVRLFHARMDDQIISSVMVLVSDRIIQYHLGCTHEAFLKLSPIRGVFEYIRKWSKESGCLWFHLGGGVGGREDSLFRFKAGFSHLLLTFETVRIVADKEAYQSLCAAQRRWLESNDLAPPDYQKDDFFPQYRRPIS